MIKINNPYEALSRGGMWFRGNLHTHTTKSDGKRDIQQVLREYVKLGYDFLMISDHDMITTLKEYSLLDTKGMVMIPGNEVTRGGAHILHVNASCKIEPSARRQEVLSSIGNSQGFAILNHPNWGPTFDHCTIEQMSEWVGYLGLEIYNPDIDRGNGSAYALDKWDIILSQGRTVWGFANDDMHGFKGDTFGKDNSEKLAFSQVGLGWNMVFAPSKSLEAIYGSMLKGCFYASSGVIIKKIEVSGNSIFIDTENAQRISAVQQIGKRFAFKDDHCIEVQVPESAKYVRFQLWGAGETFAWTQPFFISHE